MNFFLFLFSDINVFAIWESAFSKRCQFRFQMLSMQISKGLLKTKCAISRVVKMHLSFHYIYFSTQTNIICFFFVEKFFRRVVLHCKIVERPFRFAKLYITIKANVSSYFLTTFHERRKMLIMLLLKLDKYIFCSIEILIFWKSYIHKGILQRKTKCFHQKII